MRWLVVLGLLAGCSAPRPNGPVCGSVVGPGAGGGLRDGGLEVRFVAVGRSGSVRVQAIPAEGCDTRSGVQVISEVLDPDNHPIAHTISPLAYDTTGPVLFYADVTFTPAVPGPHQVSARFEPAMGTDRQVVEAVTVRTARTIELGARCSAVEQLSTGLVLCLSQDNAPQVVLARDGGRLPDDVFEGNFEVAGRAIWSRGVGVVKRRLDDGAPFADAGERVPVPLNTTQRLIPVTDDSAVALGSAGAITIGLDAGVLVVAAQRPIDLEIDLGMATDLRASFDPTRSALMFGFLDGFSDLSSRICWARLDRSDALQCRTLATQARARAIGGDATGLWVLRQGVSLEHARLVDGPDGGLDVAFTTRSMRAPFVQSPVFPPSDGFATIPRFRDGQIFFDGYELPAGFTLHAAQTLDWAQHPRGTLLLYDR